jgi:hypothetical protein
MSKILKKLSLHHSIKFKTKFNGARGKIYHKKSGGKGRGEKSLPTSTNKDNLFTKNL